MRKLTALSLSLLLSLGAFAQPQLAQKASKENAERNSVSTVFSPNDYEVSVKGMKSVKVADKQISTANLMVDNKGLKAPNKAVSVSSELYAGIIYPQAELGVQKIDAANGAMTKIFSTNYTVKAIGINGETLHMLCWAQTSSGVSDAWYKTFDLATGNELSSVSCISSFTDFPQGGAYVPEENAFYGYASSQFVKFDCATATSTKLADCVTSSGGVFCPELTYNASTGEIVGYDLSNGKLFNVVKSTGAHNNFCDAPTSQYLGGIAYDITSNCYIVNPNDDSTSSLYAIDGGSYSQSLLCELPGAAETGCLYVNENEKPDQDAPAAPEYVSSSFPNGALFGQITFTLPTKLVNGNTISGNVEYTVTANGTVVASGTGVAGSTVTSNVVVEKSGDTEFAFTATYNGHTSKKSTQKIYIGNDTPLAPTNVKLTIKTVSWSPVTKGVHNGFIDTQKMTYTVKINGELVADGLTGTSCATGLPLNAELSSYVAEVYAVCNGFTSAAGSSNSLTFGEAYSVPVTIEPTAEQAQLFTQIDANSDNKAWTYDATNKCFAINYNFSKPMDDYLFLPPVKVTDTDMLYEFSLDAWARSTSYPERLEVFVGREPSIAAMTKVVINPTDITWAAANKKAVTGIVDLPEAGKWYFAVHGISDKNEFTLYVNNFQVKKSTVAAKGPAAVTDVKAVAGANGALNATVSFKLPTVDNTGAPLKGTVECEVENMVDYKTVSGAPGSAQTVVLTCLQSTTEENDPIVITPKQGDLGGFPTQVTVWTGVDLPATPTNVRIDRNEMGDGGTLRWDLVTEGKNGGYIVPSDVDYYLCQYVVIIPGLLEGWQISGLIGKNVDEFEFDYTGALGTLRLGVAAGNAAGQNTTLGAALAAMGPALPTPAVENFAGGNITLGPVIYMGSSLKIQNPSKVSTTYADPEVPYAACITPSAYGACYYLPPFSTKGATKMAFIPKVYIGACENYRVTAEAYNVPETEIFSLADMVNYNETGWQDLQINLPAQFQDKYWVNLKVYGDCTSSQTFMLGGYKVRNMVPYDLAADAITAPKKVATGADYNVTVTAKNIGLQNINEFSVTLYEDGEAVETKTGAEIVSDATGSVVFTRHMSPVATEDIEYYATVTCNNDANTTNGQTETIVVSPKASTLPGATELQAGNGENGVSLTWLEPNVTTISPDPITEDFEDADAFSAEYGDWVFVDVDESPVGGFQGTDIPGITPGTTTGSFWVWDQGQLGNQTFEAHSGTKYLFALFRYDDGQSDDWAISPELCGDAQTISFWAKSYSASYPEKFEIYYSNGGVEPSDFTLLEDATVDPVSAEWTQYEYDLPEGAKRFAIRSCATGSFMLMIDDVTYTPAGAGGSAELQGYDVYRDGVKINSALVEDNSYVDTTAVEGQTYTYVVVAVLDLGSGKPSNAATITYTKSGLADMFAAKGIVAGKGFIQINGFAGEKVMITTADGKVVANGNADDINTVAVPAGVYVVKAGKKVAKVVVK